MKNILYSLKRPKISTSATFFVSIFCFFYYASPYFALLKFKTALENTDHATLNQMISFSSLRSSLKSQIKPPIARKLKQRIGTNILSEIGILLSDPLVNSIVDSTTTPRGIKLLLSNGIIANYNNSSNGKNDLNDYNNHSILQEKKEPQANIKIFYANPNKFVLSTQTNNSDIPLNAYWSRSNLFTWKLISVEIPVEILDQY